jgi:iron complex outermembrane receptor protein
MSSVQGLRAFRVLVGSSVIALAAAATPVFAQDNAAQGPVSPPAGGPVTTEPSLPSPSPAGTVNQAEPAAAEGGSTGVAAGGLEEIVVTARKVAENLQDVPVAVTAFSGAALAQQNAVRVSDIARSTPSLVIREGSSNPSAPSITLRGQVQTDTLATLDPSVGTYVDNFYWARAYGVNADLLDVRSVQVLKGPQGTLFGRNTTGGAILIETNDPNFNGVSGMISGTYGRFDERTGTAVLNLPVIEDVLALRGAFTYTKRDGYSRDIGTGRRYDEKNNWTGRLKALLQPTDTLRFVLSAERFDSKVNNSARRLQYVRGGTGGFLQAGGAAGVNGFLDSIGDSKSDVAVDVLPLLDLKTQTYSGTATLDTFFGAITFIGGYRNVKTTSQLDLDGSTFPIHTSTGDQDLDQYSGEVQITGKAFNDAVDFATGVTYFKEKGIDQSSSVTIPIVNPRTTLFRGDIDNDAMGIYGQATWHITDRLGLTGGLRYSVEDKGLGIFNTTVNRATGLVACQIPSLTAPNCGLERQDEFNGWSYTVGLDYKVTDDVLVYIKSSKGFRSGGQNLRASGSASFIPFQPEIAYTQEAGLKGEFFDRRVRFNAAGYYSRVNDIQRSTLVAVAPGVTATIVGNAGKIRIIGLEAELTAEPVPGFTIGASGALTRPKYLEYSDLSGDRRQERFEGVARHQFGVNAALTHEFNFAQALLRVDYSWSDKIALQAYNTPADPDNSTIIDTTTDPAGGVLSARAALTFSQGLEVSVFGRNLANRRDRVSALYVPGLAYTSGIYREPRTYGVTATYRFGQ